MIETYEREAHQNCDIARAEVGGVGPGRMGAATYPFAVKCCRAVHAIIGQ